MKYVIRDRELRCSLLKRKRAGKCSWLDHISLWLSPIGVLEDIVVSFFALGFVVLATSEGRGIPYGFASLPFVLVLFSITALGWMHAVRLAHGIRVLRRGTVIIDDLVGGAIFLTFWLLVVGGFALAFFRKFVYWLVWR